jgi:phospho-N-acetylmuramoyl-pentapeptide-transferase
MAVCVTAAIGLLGFLDDYAKVTKQTTAGVSGKLRIVLEVPGRLRAVAADHPVRAANAEGQGYSPAWPSRCQVPDLRPGLVLRALRRLVIVGAANAVNFTDGLDGLATVPVMIAGAAFGLIAYLVGNCVFAKYLQLPFALGVGELSVFCGPMHRRRPRLPLVQRPAGQDLHGRHRLPGPGRRARRGRRGDQARDRLAIIGGLFVLETCSVMVQVISFKTHRQARLPMAPIHHHFEKLGWSDRPW